MCPRAIHERIAAQLNRQIIDRRLDIPTRDKATNRRRLESDDAILRREARCAQRLDERIERFPIRLAPAFDEPGVFVRRALQFTSGVLTVVT